MRPITAYCIVWAAVVLLHSLSLLDFYDPFSLLTPFLIAGPALISWVIAKRFSPQFRPLATAEAVDGMHTAERFRDAMFIIAVCMFVFETIVFGGMPLVWMITDVPKGYADFGIPTLHGIFNGLLMFMTSASGAFAVMGSRRRKNLTLFVVGIAVMVALFSRAMLVITLIQIAAVVLFRIRGHFTVVRIAGLAVITLAGLFAFGVLGNLRSQHELSKQYPTEDKPPFDIVVDNSKSKEVLPPPPPETPLTAREAKTWSLTNEGYNPLIGMLNPERIWVFRYVPTEYLWAYTYITSGYNNLIHNVHKAPTMKPATTFAKLVPTIVYSAFGADKRIDDFTRPNQNFTVATAFAGPVSDFGYFGFLLIVPVLIGAALAYRGAKARSTRSLLLYAMLFQSIILTPYVDTVLYTTFALQLLLAYLSGVSFSKIKSAVRPNVSERLS